MNKPYAICSALLSYPDETLLEALPDIEAVLDETPLFKVQLAPLLQHLKMHRHALIRLQEDYVANFDRSRRLSLYLFEHIHGESRERGEALLDLLHEYQRHGFEPNDLAGGCREMPDYLPLFLEFLAQLPAEAAGRLLGDAVHVIGLVGERLRQDANPYAVVFELLTDLSPVKPQPMMDAPAREMDALLETVGPGPDGTEPLLKPDNSRVQTIRFYR
ncbi:MAG: nitrate reductase molybdenum cofactor assembly chaperone [Lautropia sp.]|nr:nitrate reductase molybdenum cofactor assembly chaperone [Lautropia sp.]